MALDLPAFERPANAISGPSGAGRSPGFAMEISNFALRKSDIGKEGKTRMVMPDSPHCIAQIRPAVIEYRVCDNRSRLSEDTTIKRSLLLSLLLVTGGLHAQDQAPDLAKAKQTAETICVGCHGADG